MCGDTSVVHGRRVNFNCVIAVFYAVVKGLNAARTGCLAWRPAPCQQTSQHSIEHAELHQCKLRSKIILTAHLIRKSSISCLFSDYSLSRSTISAPAIVDPGTHSVKEHYVHTETDSSSVRLESLPT